MSTVTVSLSPEEDALLKQLANAQSRSDADLVREALREYLRFEAAQLAKINDGVAAADRGDFASEDEVEAFFAKYADSP